jgi:hypothetical protein
VTFLEAAEKVLKSARRPLTTLEVVDEAVKKGLIQPQGKTPVASMKAALYGAPPGTPVKRVYDEGPRRARRGSVRWRYEKPTS